jgi:hypothetical protein
MPFTAPEFNRFSREEALSVMRSEMEKAIMHFGEGHLNPSTIACIFALVEERLTGHAPTAAPDSSTSRDLFEAVGWAKPRPHQD